MAADQRDHDEDLLNLKLPCSVSTAVLSPVITSIYCGQFWMTPEHLLPVLKLGDAIQVSEMHGLQGPEPSVRSRYWAIDSE